MRPMILEKPSRKRYPRATRLLISAGSGGSNSPRTRLWRWALQQFANETGVNIEVCHYPPGTSKWNKIEHRLFCHITRYWQGVHLETFEIVINLRIMLNYANLAPTEATLYYRTWFSRATAMHGGRLTIAKLVFIDGRWKIDLNETLRLTANNMRGEDQVGVVRWQCPVV